MGIAKKALAARDTRARAFCSARRLSEVLTSRRPIGRSRCCFDTVSITSTSRPATETPSCASGRGSSASRDAFSSPPRPDARPQEAREDLHRSLDRLGVDHVDLWQLHNLADPIEWDIALSSGGAIEAAVQARDEGLVRFIGVTGHGAQIAANHRRSLERFDFDSVLLPYNFVTMRLPYYAENFEALVKTCVERRVAVQTIKSIALRPWMGARAPPRRGTNRSRLRRTSTSRCLGAG